MNAESASARACGGQDLAQSWRSRGFLSAKQRNLLDRGRPEYVHAAARTGLAIRCAVL
jgi:hypothetical protein